MAARPQTSARDSAQDRRRAREDRGLAGTATQARTDRLPPAPRERRPLLAALAVLLIVGGAATAGLLALRADERVPVLVAAREITAGEAITADALTTTSVASEGTMLIPAADSATLAGTYARSTIRPGQLLDTSMLTTSSTLEPGKVGVGALLAIGRMPSSGLQAGDVVQLVRVDVAGGKVMVPDALVSSSRSTATDGVGRSGGASVTFIVAEDAGAEVAAVAAAGDLAAVLVTRGHDREDG